jgi:hypothetical protein
MFLLQSRDHLLNKGDLHLQQTNEASVQTRTVIMNLGYGE